ncbi:uncharacterized protein LOC129796317 isoform X1 [Lutzomyia longipalpis]|uniref:uncharacterized protein LOC129796317 isoform X1 n=1 Tax=Lutzomyia longipalpis TaxID=7200 RepID=UPI002483B967|nr:uncharacterized protein LOC129796317 isoform X1 [Lutzomyia longipalpis]
MSCTSGVVRDRKPGDCPCASVVEINLKVKACRCNGEPIDRQPMPQGDSPARDFIAVDLVSAVNKEIREKMRVNVPGDRRRVLVLKLTDVTVRCGGGMSHELQFANGTKHFVSKGDSLKFTMKESDVICSKTNRAKDKGSAPKGGGESKKKSIRKVLKSQKSEDGKMYSKSVDDVTLGSKKTLTVESDGKILSKSVQDLSEESHSEFSDMNSIELIIISDEFLNETTKQEVIIVNDRKDIESRRQKLAVKDKPKRDKSPKEVTRKSTTNQSRRRLVIISDEYKKKSLENKTIVVTKGKYDNAPKKDEAPKKKQEKSIADAVGEINSKIISCVLQSYEEPEAAVLENKDIKQNNTDTHPSC